jgi:hypothetical protein
MCCGSTFTVFDGINYLIIKYLIFTHLVNFGSSANLIDVADHVEGDFGQVVVLALQDLLEAGDGLLNGHQLAGVVREHLRNLATLNNVKDLLRASFFSIFSQERGNLLVSGVFLKVKSPPIAK